MQTTVIKNLIRTEIEEEYIKVRLGDNCLLFSVKEDRIYFNGERIKTTNLEHRYNRSKMFERNKEIPKKRIKTLKFNGLIFGLDVGFDGRLFGKVWKQKDFDTFRGPPFFTFSYWSDRRGKEIKWYEEDLHTPKRVYNTEYSGVVEDY